MSPSSRQSTSIFVAIRPALYTELFSPEADARLRQLGRVTFYTSDENPSVDDLARSVAAHQILITGWGTPTVTDDVLAAAGDLQIIAHSAGSIRRLLPLPVFEQGIQVTHAAGAIAPAVADMTLLLIMTLLRRTYESDRILRESGDWERAKLPALGEEIEGQRIGVVGAGYTGRCVIDLLQRVGAEIWVHDPYLSRQDAQMLQVTQVGLDELFAGCGVVTLQAPVTPETERMIGARQLSLLRDGGIFVNTARGVLVDQEALLAELQRGRIRAALDVFDPEPLPRESPLHSLPNVVLTAHIAGASVQARRRQGDVIVAEIERFLAGEDLHYPVTREMLATIA